MFNLLRNNQNHFLFQWDNMAPHRSYGTIPSSFNWAHHISSNIRSSEHSHWSVPDIKLGGWSYSNLMANVSGRFGPPVRAVELQNHSILGRMVGGKASKQMHRCDKWRVLGIRPLHGFEPALCIETFSEPSNYIQTHIVKLKKKAFSFLETSSDHLIHNHCTCAHLRRPKLPRFGEYTWIFSLKLLRPYAMVCDIKNPERMHCKCLYEEEAWVQDVSASNLTFHSKFSPNQNAVPSPCPSTGTLHGSIGCSEWVLCTDTNRTIRICLNAKYYSCKQGNTAGSLKGKIFIHTYKLKMPNAQLWRPRNINIFFTRYFTFWWLFKVRDAWSYMHMVSV